MAMRPTWGTSKIGFTSLAPFWVALAAVASTLSTAIVGNPAFLDLLELGRADVEEAADHFTAHLGDPVGLAFAHRHGLEGPASNAA